MNKSPYLRRFSLIQHTPMIHFQADQTGATLRATDVKPKIDRYIWEKLPTVQPEVYEKYKAIISEKNFSRPSSGKKQLSGYRIHISGQPASWYLPAAYISRKQSDHVVREANRYFSSLPGNPTIELLDNTPFFANNDKIAKDKWHEVRLAVMYRNLELEVFSRQPEVTQLVSEVLPYVFATHNFGTRNNKGFGHFSIPGNEGNLLKELTPYRFSVRVNSQKDILAYRDLFGAIGTLYGALRSGINSPDGFGSNQRGSKFYCKSLLFRYFRDKGIQWDKRTIKDKFYLAKLHDQQGEPWTGNNEHDPVHFSHSNQKLVRSLLGLSSSQTWGKAYWDDEIAIDHQSGDRNELIERFASPIWFKPVRSSDGKYFDVYIGANSVPDRFLNQNFEITRTDRHKNRKGSFQLSTPGSFDIHDFLKFALTEVDIRGHIDGKFDQTREFRQLTDIFDSIHK